MGFDIRLPQINAPTEKEQLAQTRSYLFYLAEQLQWALNNLETSKSTVVVGSAAKSLVPTTHSTESPESTFASIKALIIKSADIVNAYYDEIHKKLEGLYVAQSDFGTYKQQTSQDITSSATRIDNAFTNIQSIESNIQDVDTSIEDVKTGIQNNVKELKDDIGQLDSDLTDAKGKINKDIVDIKRDITTLNFALVEVNANIRSGLLYYDDNEIPVYGLEIGQTNTIDGEEVFKKFARFTSDRLSFYDQNGEEVAYISDYKLYITNAEITGTLKLGAFLIDTTSGFKLKYVGRG